MITIQVNSLNQFYEMCKCETYSVLSCLVKWSFQYVYTGTKSINTLKYVHLIYEMENTVVEIENELLPKLTILEYHKNPDTIKKLNISDLRGILKYHKKQIMDISKRYSTRTSSALYRKLCNKIHDFTLVGNKGILLDRVKLFFKQHLLTTRIQKCVRGYFVRLIEKLHGPAWSNRDVCTNTSDFCTLEPLNEISRQDFVSYADLKGTAVYGFDVNSLLSCIKKRARLENPYTRETMEHCIPNIHKLNRLTRMISVRPSTAPTRGLPVDSVQSQMIRTRIESIVLPTSYKLEDVIQKIGSTREHTLDARIQNLFMEIDNLGNYTDMSWFYTLNSRDYVRYFRIMRDMWNFRGRIPFHVKLTICPLWDPFVEIANNNNNNHDMNFDDVKKLCITVMEDMVYMGIDKDARMLGAFQVLTALTLVSDRARSAMPWLYESLF